ncbi:unnamed protein product [Miscanthus lutarioriparius]|uniref:Uncharacterized protein n=1 Tax=Miscanthus lutarioriparius TaxID=422564 RepID=A0A811PR74_9POAL|nr:unnamed protein product [Miscanthus lutarioriparius]
MAVWRLKTARHEAGAPVPPQIQNATSEIKEQARQASPEDRPFPNLVAAGSRMIASSSASDPMMLEAGPGTQAPATAPEPLPEEANGPEHTQDCSSPENGHLPDGEAQAITKQNKAGDDQAQDARDVTDSSVQPISSPAPVSESASQRPPASPAATQPTAMGDEAATTETVAADASEQRGTSAAGKLKRFNERILRKAAAPLLPAKVQDQPSTRLPTRSRRITAQPLSRVRASMRGEILVMKRLGMLPEHSRPSSTAVEAYDSISLTS